MSTVKFCILCFSMAQMEGLENEYLGNLNYKNSCNLDPKMSLGNLSLKYGGRLDPESCP